MPDEAVNTDEGVLIERLVVTRSRGPVLKDLSCVAMRGRVTGLLGPSGCGKTTLMRCVVGLQAITSGRVTVLGEPAGTPSLRRRIGYVTQAPSVYGDLSVTENLRYFAAVLGAPSADVGRVIHQVDLTSHARDVVSALSGGEIARVSLAVSLLGSPELLVMDEPTVGLDPVLREELWDLFRELSESGVAILVSSHVMDEASRCDDLLMLREGRLIASGTPEEMLDRTGTTDLDAAFLELVQRTTTTTEPVT
jgi:ABC-2 type transport system ATP-binding protein